VLKLGILKNAGASFQERGLSQTAARVLARALNLPARAFRRHAAS
jgi:AcrR family transcriptional regulator